MHDPLIYKTPCSILVTGSTNSGKTVLTSKLLKSVFKPQSDYLVILSPTQHLSGDFSEYQEDGDRVRKFHDPAVFRPVIQEIVEQSEAIRSSGVVDRKDFPQITIVIDDAVGHPLLRFGGYLDQLSTKSRHLGISLIVLVQRHSAAGRTFRLNCRYVLAFQQVNLSELERFIQELVPKSLQRPMRLRVSEIYNEPYSYIAVNCFATRIRERMYLNGETPIYDMLVGSSSKSR